MAASVYAQASGDRDFADINVTPLVDVLLVLLIIFMVTAPTLSKAVPFDLPQPNPRPQPTPPQKIHLAILADGTVTWNGIAQPRNALQSLMQVEAQRDPAHAPILEIDASGDADYGIVTRVLGDAKAAELNNIAFVQR